MKYPKLRELKQAIKALVKGPYTSKYPFEPHVPFPQFRGKPEYDEKRCVGCGACAQVCPARAIDVVDDTAGKEPSRELILHYDTCIFCGQCQANCITDEGIKLTNEYDLALFDRKKAVVSVKKPLVVCDACRTVIGAKDHLVFLARKLGLLSYANPTLVLASQKELKLIEDEQPSDLPPPPVRADMFRVLCPKCRHKVVISDIRGYKT